MVTVFFADALGAFRRVADFP